MNDKVLYLAVDFDNIESLKKRLEAVIEVIENNANILGDARANAIGHTSVGVEDVDVVEYDFEVHPKGGHRTINFIID